MARWPLPACAGLNTSAVAQAGFAMRKVVITGKDGVQYRKTEVAAGGVTGCFRAFMTLVCLLKVSMEVAALIGGAAYVLCAARRTRTHPLARLLAVACCRFS